VAHSGDDAMRLCLRHAPDVILLDVDLGDSDGLEFAPRLLEGHPERHIVAATAHDTDDVAVRALRAGATGFVSKERGFDHLLGVIRGVMRGETWIPPRLLTAVLRDIQGHEHAARELDSVVRGLTPRERAVLAGMVGGLDRGSIARDLGISVDTVRTHTQNLFAKLRVHSALEAVALAVRAGMGRPEDRPT
jgi:DNA-binding NarL/FixJ family response regulator